MTSSFKVRIRILSVEVGYLSMFELTRRKVSSNNNSRKICKQATIKLSWAYSFRNMFFIGQNLKYVHMTYFLIFF